MSDIAIKVEGLSKLYKIGSRQNGYKTLRDSIATAASSPFRRLSSIFSRPSAVGSSESLVDGLRSAVGSGQSSVGGRRSAVAGTELAVCGHRSAVGSDESSVSGRPSAVGSSESAVGGHRSAVDSETLWALKNVSFEVRRGEVVGIIGRNGAGKSTLLKILSRITEPTEGYAEIRGRVGSLLEVGTGFHAELSGRENIYLSGAILGMRKTEIERKFDEIVAFAEIEKFLDTPVKHYSSGMYVRLAFAVAAHLDPEILLVDEVLAVGDVAFQKKCLGKMGDVAKGGRTVIFVSHQMNQMRRLCERVAWLDSGELVRIGSAAEVIGGYETAMSSISLDADRGIENGHVGARFLKWEILEPREAPKNLLKGLGPITIRFIVKVLKSIKNGRHGIALFNSDNQLIWATVANGIKLEPGTSTFCHYISTLPVRPGIYYWQVSLYDDNGLVDLWFGLPEMIVATESTGHPLDIWQGVLNLPWKFSVRQEKG